MLTHTAGRWKRGAISALVAIGLLSGTLAATRGGNALASRHSTTNITVWYSTDDPIESSWISGIVPLFESLHSDITVTLKVYDLDDFNDKMQDALSSNTGPDLAYATPRAPGTPIYVIHGKLANLTSFANSHHWGSLLRPGLLNYWNAPFGVWYAKAKHKSVSKTTQIYGAPHELATAAFLYNTNLLKKLNLKVPKTVAELQSDAAAAKKKGYIPFGIGNQDLWVADAWYLSLVNGIESPSYLKGALRDSSGFSYGQGAFKSAASTLSGWNSKGYFTPSFAGLDAQDGMESFFDGNTLFQLASSSEAPQIQSEENESHMPIGVFAFPASIRGKTGTMLYSGYEGWIVPKHSSHQTQAETFIDFMLRSTATNFLMSHGVLPTARVSPSSAPDSWQREFLALLAKARLGVYADAAPVPNLSATEQGNLNQLLAKKENASTLQSNIKNCYRSYGSNCKHNPDIDGEY